MYGGHGMVRELTKKQQIFLEHYIKTSNGLEALHLAYPNSKEWTYNAQHVEINKILNKPNVNLKLQEHNRAVESALANSTTLNKRKILNEIIELQQQCKEAGQGQAGVNLQALKLLSQIAGLLQENTQINVQVNNNTVVNEVSDFLNL